MQMNTLFLLHVALDRIVNASGYQIRLTVNESWGMRESLPIIKKVIVKLVTQYLKEFVARGINVAIL